MRPQYITKQNFQTLVKRNQSILGLMLRFLRFLLSPISCLLFKEQKCNFQARDLELRKKYRSLFESNHIKRKYCYCDNTLCLEQTFEQHKKRTQSGKKSLQSQSKERVIIHIGERGSYGNISPDCSIIDLALFNNQYSKTKIITVIPAGVGLSKGWRIDLKRINQELNDIYQYWRDRKPNAEIILVGHSLGSGLALQTAKHATEIQRPPSQVILLAPMYNLKDVCSSHGLIFVQNLIPNDIHECWSNDKMIEQVSPNTQMKIIANAHDLIIDFQQSWKLLQKRKSMLVSGASADDHQKTKLTTLYNNMKDSFQNVPQLCNNKVIKKQHDGNSIYKKKQYCCSKHLYASKGLVKQLLSKTNTARSARKRIK